MSVDELQKNQTDQIVQMASFRVGDEDFVIDIMRIKEIISPLEITPVHDLTGLIEGVINLRGAIIPVVDMRKRFGLAPIDSTRRTRIIIATVGSKVVGFKVDEVLEVVRIPRSKIGPPPQLNDQREPGMLLGVCQRDERLLLLLNLKKVLSQAFFLAAGEDKRGQDEV